jgi:DNA-binding CsgD family transcriptional regulator/tetratricopeptide (TPR) repeat protein
VELLEREDEQTLLRSALHSSRTEGRVVVVGGEAGIGKTALVASVCEEPGSRRVLWGACDPLVTPRTLGPLRDVARDAGGALSQALEADGSREALLAAVLDELTRSRSILVVEDVHWADDATLDLVALLGRRLARSRGCLVMTCRTEALTERPEVRRALGAIPPEVLRRIEPAPLSATAVETLAGRTGRPARDLHRVSGGNPFFVTEVLAAPSEAVPVTIRDAVAVRVGALGPEARAVTEIAAVVPGATELRLLTDTVAASPDAIDACARAGILQVRDDAVVFRHDLARRAVESEIGPARRRELDGAVLRALEATDGVDPARLAHHARQAGDTVAIRRHAPVAARSASAAGSHRQALEHWEAALKADAGAMALEGVSVEAYLCGELERALEARRALLRIHEAGEEANRVGEDLRWLSRILWWAGQGAEAAAAADQAIAVLESLPESRELAMALSGRSQLLMLNERHVEAIEIGDRAIDLARRIGDQETYAHALTNVGTAVLGRVDHERGRSMLEEAHARAVEAGEDDHAARALVNLATCTLMRRRDDLRVERDLERAIAFAAERDLDGYVQYLLGARAHLRLRRGEWAEAEADAHASMSMGEHRGVSLCPALLVLGRLQSRRGEPEATDTLEDAWERAVSTGELQRLAPAAIGLAEHAWLDGDLDASAAAIQRAWPVANERDDDWARGELAWWLWRSGELGSAPSDLAYPYARAIAGDWSGAAEAWTTIGFPYEAAEMLSDAEDPDARVRALAVFDGLGAARSASALRLRLRALGVRRIPRGPRASTSAGPAGLTPRQLDVLTLLAEGATNAEIARRLVIAPKTVDHHVSAVLAKLGVASRREAAAAAAALGVGISGPPDRDPAPTGLRPPARSPR